jgi:serine/threonine protein kinase
MALGFLKRTFPAIPHYEVLEKIAEGGTSSVYKGRHQTTGELVAIKVVKAQMAREDDTLLKRFEQEFQAATKLQHPNIVRALDFGQDGSATYLVMEFVEGRNLHALIQKDGPLPEAEARRIITQVAQALHYAHQHRIVHRDVKPGNILLQPTGQAKLTDFGLVKDLAGHAKLTSPLCVLGTPHFMAPEQYEDATGVDPRSDLYALAATLYYAATGKLPFEAEAPFAALKKQATNDLVPPRQLVPTLSGALDRAICTALSSDPARRPASVLAFVRLLKPRDNPSPRTGATREAPNRGESASRADQSERESRASVRYPYAVGTTCAVDPSVHGAAEGEDLWPATVQDVSTGGIALILGRRFEPGTVLLLDLHANDLGSTQSWKVEVKRVRSKGSGSWLIGCAFLEQLGPEDLHAFLAGDRSEARV